MKYAGNLLFRGSVDSSFYTKSDQNQYSKGELYPGKGGFSRQRWDFWREAFENLARGDMVSEVTKVECQKAVDQMLLEETWTYAEVRVPGLP